MGHELRLTRPQIQHKNPQHMYLKLLTPSVEKNVNLLWRRFTHEGSELYKPRNKNELFSHCGSSGRLIRSDCEGFSRFYISIAVKGTDDDMLWNGSGEDGMLGVSVRKVNAVTVKVETETMTGTVWHALCVNCMQLTVWCFFLADFYF
jgi:hypothetical protein